MEDLLGLGTMSTAPAPMRISASQYTSKKPEALGVSGGGGGAPTASDPFDTWWEALGGSPRPSASAPKLVSTRNKPTAPGGAIDFSMFEPSGSGGGGGGGDSRTPSDEAEVHHHHEEEHEEADEEVEETDEPDIEAYFSRTLDDSASDGTPAPDSADSGSNSARFRSGAGATASGSATRAPGASRPTSFGTNTSSATTAAAPQSIDGVLWVRVSTAFVMKRWKERYASLKNGVIKLWTDQSSKLRGDPPLESITLSAHMALSTMKVHTSGSTRIFYRHIAALNEGVALTTVGGQATAADAAAAAQRVFKFGSSSQPEFERWSRVIRTVVDGINAKERDRAANALAIDSAMNASDLFRSAIASPRHRSKRRLSFGSGGGGSTAVTSGGTLNISIRLLDDSVHHVVVSRGATVKDVLVAFRRLLSLHADADFSLYLRQKTAEGLDTFACLPDVMSAAEAEALAFPDNRDLVYKRRLYLPEPEEGGTGHQTRARGSRDAGASGPGGSGAGIYDAGLADEIPDVDAEASAATSITDGAHHLLFVEAVYHVTQGLYLLPFQDALLMAGLQLLSEKGKVSAEDAAAVATNPSHKLDYYRMRLPDVMAAQAIAQHKATSGKGVDDLVTALRREHIRLGESLTAFQAERLYIKRVQQLPEYGASFFTCTLVRTTTDDPVAHGSRSAPPVPAWAEDITVSRVGAAGAPPPLPVLVGINATGVMLRPLPPMHSAGTSYAYSANAPGTRRGTYPTLLSAPTASEELTDDGAPVGWLVHPVHFVEVWGIKKSRPTFTYRVRERYLRIIELTSTSYKEMASTLHMFVFALLAQREGKPKRSARAEASDYGSMAQAAKLAAREAQAEALSELPAGWSVIQDPITGSVAYWNQFTKQTVFSRPTV